MCDFLFHAQEQGIKHNKMMFDDLVASLAFQHCEGVLKRPDHSASSSTGSMVNCTSSSIVYPNDNICDL